MKDKIKKCIKCRNKGRAWFHNPKDFHCSQCGEYGFPSIYGIECTACSNLKRIANGEINL
jgi:hypothetical protein